MTGTSPTLPLLDFQAGVLDVLCDDARADVLYRTSEVLAAGRSAGHQIVHVRTASRADYSDAAVERTSAQAPCAVRAGWPKATRTRSSTWH